MSEQQAPPQYSPDGRWWWDGQAWVPVPAKKNRSVLLVVVGVVGALLLLLVLAGAAVFMFSAPVGTQHDTSEVEGYCEVFPEDC